MTKTEAIKLLLSSFGIICLFGLTWVFAVFTFTSHNSNISFALQFVFSFFNVFQGFGIFLFFVVLSSDARDEWRRLLCKCLIKEESSSKYEPPSISTKFTNVKSSKPYHSTSHSSKNGGNLEAEFAISKQFSQGMIHVNSVAFEEEKEDNLPDILELREKVLAERVMEKSSVNVPLPLIDEMKPTNENEYVTLPLRSTNEVKPAGDSNTKDKKVNQARIKRHSTTRHTNHVEKAELDFFDDFSDDDDETIL